MMFFPFASEGKRDQAQVPEIKIFPLGRELNLIFKQKFPPLIHMSLEALNRFFDQLNEGSHHYD